MAFGAKIKLSVDNSNAAAFREEIQKYVSRATSGGNALKVGVKIDKDSIVVPKSIANDIKRQINGAGKIGITVKLDKVDSTGAIKTLRNDIQTMLRGLNITGLKDFLGTEGVDATAAAIGNAKQSIQETKGYLADLQSVAATYKRSYESAIGGKNAVTDATELENIRQKYVSFNQELERIKSNSASVSAEEIKNLADVGVAQQQEIERLKEKQRVQKEGAKTAQQVADEEAAALKKSQDQTAMLTKRLEAMYAKINRYASINTRAYSAKGGQFQDLYRGLEDIRGLIAKGDFDEASRGLNNIQTEFTRLGDNVRLAGLEGKSFFEILEAGWAKFGGWSIITKSMTTAWRLMKDMVSTVRELDTAMTELKKVTDLTNAGYERYIDVASGVAQRVGASLADTVKSTADFARLGYSIEDATSLAESALVYFNVGDGIQNIDAATEALISTMKAFDIEASDSMSIVDKYNKVGNEFPISSAAIGTALQKSAAAMASANNTLEETIGLATAMNSVVQNPEIVGTSLKTISMYLRSAKTELEDAGEATDGIAESTSKLRDLILGVTKGAVDIQLDENTFKSTYQIIKEISQVWDTLSDIDQAALLEKMGGKRNANTVAALISNFDLAEEAMTAALNASGSALEENDKYLTSIDGRLSVISAKWQALSQSLLGSDIVKSVLGIADGLLSVATVLEKIHGLLPVITALGVVGANGLSMRKTNPMAAEIMQTYDAMSKQLIITEQMASKLGGLTAHEQALVAIELQRRLAVGQVTAEEARQIITTSGLAAAEGTLTMVGHSLTGMFATLVNSIKGIGAAFATAFASNPVGMILTVTSVAISAVRWFKEWHKTTAELIEEYSSNINSITDETRSIADSFKSLKENSDDIIPKFAELSEHVDKFGNNIDLTDEQYKEYINLSNQIAEMFPELDAGFDSNGNHMLALSGNADTLKEALYELVEAQRLAANQEIAAKLPEAFENAKGLADAHQKDIDGYEASLAQMREMQDAAKSGSETLDMYAIALQDVFGDRWLSVLDKFTDTETEQVDWAGIINSQEFDNQIAVIENKIDDSQQKISSAYKELNPIIASWMQTDFNYQELDDDMQNIANRLVGQLDFSTLGLTTEQQVKTYITDNIIQPFYDAAPEVRQAFSYLTDGSLSDQITSVNNQINALFNSVGKGNVDYNLRPYLKDAEGFYHTMNTQGYQVLEGEQAMSLVITPVLEDGSELSDEELTAYVDNLQDQLYEKMEAGEKVDIDTLLSLDSAKLIVTAMAGEWDKNAEKIDAFESKLQPLKDMALLLHTMKEADLDSLFDGLEIDDAVKDQLKDIIKGLSDVESAAKKAGSALSNSFEKLSVRDAIAKVKDIEDVTKAIGGLMVGVRDSDTGKGLDVAGLKTVVDTFGDTKMAGGLDKWLSRLNAAKDSASETTLVLTDMLNEWIAQEHFLDQTGESYEILKRALEECGFSFVAFTDEQKNFLDQQWEAIKANQENAASADEAAEAMQRDIDALVQEATELGISQQEWVNYYLAKYSSSGSISTSGDIAALAALIGVLDSAQAAWIDFYKARADMLKSAQKHVASGGLPSDFNNKGTKDAIKASRENQILNDFQKNKGDMWGMPTAQRDTLMQDAAKRANGNYKFSDYSIDSKGNLVGGDVQGNVVANGLADYIDKGIEAGDEYAKGRLEEELQRILKMATTGGEGIGGDFDADKATGASKTGGSNKGGGSDGSNKSKKEKEDDYDKNRIDWIQRRIDMLQKLHDIEEENANDESKSFGDRIASLETMRNYDKDLITIYQAQADAYKESYDTAFGAVKAIIDANGDLKDQLGGDIYTIETIKQAIEEGILDLSKFSDEEYKAIEAAISEYDTYQKAVDKVREKEREEHEEFMEEYELRIKEVQSYLDVVQNQATGIENELSLIEARGEVVTASTYKRLISNSKEQMGLYEDQIDLYEEMLGELQEGSEEYNSTLASIEECRNAIQECELKQIEWNEAIRDIPIKRIEKYLATLRDIKTDITNFISEQEALGKVIDAGAYKELVSLSTDEIKKLLDQQKLLKDKLKDYDFGSEKYKETSDQIQEIDDNISEVLQSMSEWNRAILELPINKLNDVTAQLTLMKGALDDVIDDYDQVISGVTYLIDQETERIEKQRDAYEKMMDERIKAIQDIIDALEKENEAREKVLAVEQAEYDLDRANTQKTIAIIQDGQKQFIADQNAIREAQNALNEANYEKRLWELQQEIDALEKEKEAMLADYDRQLDFLDAQADKWSKIASQIEGARDMLVSLQYLGSGWDTKVLTGKDTAIYNTFRANYQTRSDQQYAYEKQIESNERIAELMQAYVDSFLAGSITYEKALSGVQSLTKNINSGLQAMANITETQKLLGSMNGVNGSSVNTVLGSLEQLARNEANNYPEYFRSVNANIKSTEQYTKSWEELKKQVEAEKALLEKQWKEMQEAKEAQKTLASTVKHSDRDGGNVISTAGTYVAVNGAGDYTKYEGGRAIESGNIRGSSMSELHNKGYSSSTIIAEGAGHYTVPKYHDGIDHGAVGKMSDDDRVKALQAMALTPIESNEVPAILKAGEVVLNKTQQQNLLANMNKINPQSGGGVNVSLEMNNLTFHEIQNGRDFANFITKNLSSAVAQGLSKS